MEVSSFLKHRGALKTIVYQAYGSLNSYQQTVFSILSLYYHAGSEAEYLQVVIYTTDDAPLKKYLGGLPVFIEFLSPEQIQAYKGPNDFIHRMKIFIIEDCMNKYQTDILYVDGDTFFLQNPIALLNQISPTVSVMHVAEYDMHGTKSENHIKLSLRRSLEDEVFLGGRNFTVPLSSIMWNAGVIGLSYENKHLLKDVVCLTDQLYDRRPVHTAEQFAFSYILQTNTHLVAAEAYIKHYWDPLEKKSLTNQLKHFFLKNVSRPLDKLLNSAHVLARENTEVKIPVPSFFDRLKLRVSLVLHVALKGRLP